LVFIALLKNNKMKKFFSVKKSQKVKIKTVKIMNKIKIKMTKNNGIME
jgi:hypothetical protein